MVTNADTSSGRPPQASRRLRRRKRSMAAIVAGVTMGAGLSLVSGLSGLLPGLGSGANAASVLSGKVYRDLNQNGVQDAPVVDPRFNEVNIQGVAVTAFTTTGAIAGSAVTGPDGTWTISTQVDGPFRVEFTNPPNNFYPTSGTGVTSVQFPVVGAGINYGLFAKVNGLGEIEQLVGHPIEVGNRVWLDANNNGIQDPGESGINGVTLTITAPDGSPVPSVTGPNVAAQQTTMDGNYYFRDLFPGRPYVIHVAGGQQPLSGLFLSPAFAQSGPNSAARDSNGVADNADFKMDAGSPLYTDHTFDIGFVPNSVTSTTTSSTTTSSTTTSSTTTSSMTTSSTTSSTTSTTTSSTTPSSTTSTTIAPKTYCLGDRVWDDTNSNGVQDAGEPGVNGVTVTLYNRGSATIRTQVPTAGAGAAAGGYQFCGLSNGDYDVVFTLPSGRVFTQAGQGANRGTDSNPDITTGRALVTINNADDLTIDAGLVAPAPVLASLGDRVWFDTNSNGVQDAGELGVVGATVSLYTGDGTFVRSMLTIADGRYTFFNLTPGTPYFVVVSQVPGYTFTTLRVGGNNDGLDSDVDGFGRTRSVTLAPGEFNANLDAGLVAVTIVSIPTTVPPTTTTPPTTVPPTTAPPTTVPPTTVPVTTAPPTTVPVTACLGDKVFKDPGSAKDGIGIPGVSLALVRPDGSTITTVTDGLGIYGFCGLAGGTYTVKVTGGVPVGSVNTYDLDGNHDGAATVVLPAGTKNLDVDFGYAIPHVQGTELVYTGANSFQLFLWSLTFLLIGAGLFGLARTRRSGGYAY